MGAEVTHYVYVICHEKDGKWCGPVKVGMGADPSKRLYSLQTGNPNKLHLLWQFSAPNKQMSRRMEHGFHQTKKAHRMQGEWFDLEPIVAVQSLCLLFSVVVHICGFRDEEANSILEDCLVSQASILWEKPEGVLQ